MKPAVFVPLVVVAPVVATTPLSGCTPSTLAWVVPKLELRARLSRTKLERDASTLTREHVGTALSAWLVWQPVIAAQSVPGPLELTPSAWVAPCALDDTECLQEMAEAEDEVAAALTRAP